MELASFFSRSRYMRAGSFIDWLLFAFSAYLVPALIAAATVIAFLWAPRQFESNGSLAVYLHVVPDKSGSFTPENALQALRGQQQAPSSRPYSTRLAETPFWFLFDVPVIEQGQPTLIEFPSRHAQTIACWDASTLARLGQGDRWGASGKLRPVKAGFELPIDAALPAQRTVLCRGTFSGPAYLNVRAWSAHDLDRSTLDFHEDSALVAGGLLTLAVFVFVTALINREWTYVIFAAWLVGNLRLCANAMGWDTEWIGRLIPPDHMQLLRQATFAIYYVLTAALFGQLFRRELKRERFRWMLRLVQYIGLLMLAAAAALSYAQFIPVLWTLSSFGMAVLIFLLARLLWMTRSRTVLWYVASMTIVLFSIFSEVLGAAFDIKPLFGGVNPVITVLSASMMAAFAIAEQMCADRERRRRMQTELRNTYEVAPIGLFTLDENGRFVRANPALRTMLDMRNGEYKARHWKDYFEPGAWGLLQALAQKGSEGELELRGSLETGTAERRYSLKATHSNGWIEASLQDVTERSKAIERLHFLAEHDPLTGALNRRGVERAIAGRSDDHSPWALAYIDLDRFKLVNELFGHRAGDEVLKQVVARTRSVMKPEYSVGRIVGGEFVCVMGNTAIDDAIAQCRELLSVLSVAPYQVGNCAFQVKASIGLVECSHGVRAQDALSTAEAACREAKGVAHEHLVTYRKGAAVFEERARELMLVETLGQNRLPPGLFLVMQPIMSLAAPAASLDFEVLLRWRAPDGSVLPAGKVIVAAEESGDIATIDKWVLATVLHWIETNRHALSKTEFVCVNLSGGSLNDEQFMEDIFALFARYRPIIRYLCLEITESVALHDLENTQRFITRFHDMGGKIALDDFGAGYTSFKYLKELSADALKIDGEFIRTMCAHSSDTAIVEAIVALARNLGMRSIAEWVEDAETLRSLKQIGVDYVQGFAIARPQESAAILGAGSAASFISDPATLEFVNGLIEPAARIEDEDEVGVRAGLH